MNETMVDAQVTYTLEHLGKFYIIEHVPAHVCQETGEQYFSPKTVEHIQEKGVSLMNVLHLVFLPEHPHLLSHQDLVQLPAFPVKQRLTLFLLELVPLLQ